MCGRDKIAVGCHKPVLEQCSSFLKEILNKVHVAEGFETTILLPDARSDTLWHCLKLIYKGETEANELELIDILELLNIFKIQITFNAQTSKNARIRRRDCFDTTSATQCNILTSEAYTLGEQMLNAEANTKGHIDESTILLKVEIEEPPLFNGSLHAAGKQETRSDGKSDSNYTPTENSQQQSPGVNIEMQKSKWGDIDAPFRLDEHNDQSIEVQMRHEETTKDLDDICHKGKHRHSICGTYATKYYDSQYGRPHSSSPSRKPPVRKVKNIDIPVVDKNANTNCPICGTKFSGQNTKSYVLSHFAEVHFRELILDEYKEGIVNSEGVCPVESCKLKVCNFNNINN